jgi:hypothetical protein
LPYSRPRTREIDIIRRSLKSSVRAARESYPESSRPRLKNPSPALGGRKLPPPGWRFGISQEDPGIADPTGAWPRWEARGNRAIWLSVGASYRLMDRKDESGATSASRPSTPSACSAGGRSALAGPGDGSPTSAHRGTDLILTSRGVQGDEVLRISPCPIGCRLIRERTSSRKSATLRVTRQRPSPPA